MTGACVGSNSKTKYTAIQFVFISLVFCSFGETKKVGRYHTLFARLFIAQKQRSNSISRKQRKSNTVTMCRICGRSDRISATNSNEFVRRKTRTPRISPWGSEKKQHRTSTGRNQIMERNRGELSSTVYSCEKFADFSLVRLRVIFALEWLTTE